MSDNKSLTNLGYLNEWTEKGLPTPAIIQICRRMKHRTHFSIVSNCVTEHSCKICGYKYKIDSGD